MEAPGITFNYEKYAYPVSYTVTIRGDRDSYIKTIRSLLSLIRHVNQECIDPDAIIDTLDLIEDLLPLPEQIINLPAKTPEK